MRREPDDGYLHGNRNYTEVHLHKSGKEGSAGYLPSPALTPLPSIVPTTECNRVRMIAHILSKMRQLVDTDSPLPLPQSEKRNEINDTEPSS